MGGLAGDGPTLHWTPSAVANVCRPYVIVQLFAVHLLQVVVGGRDESSWRLARVYSPDPNSHHR